MKHLFLLIISAISLIACSSKNEISPIRKDIEELVFASGQLEWDDAYNLTTQTDGVLTNLSFEIGDKVPKGKVLAFIDNPFNKVNQETAQKQFSIANTDVSENAPALQQVEQNLAFAESKYKQDAQQLERYQSLFSKGAVAKLELENAELAAKNSLANLNALKKQYNLLKKQAVQQQINAGGQLENAAINENYNNVVVLTSGTIVKKFKSTGDYVRKGEVIAVIANQNKTEAVLNVDESSIGKIKVGQEVFIRLNTNKDKVHKGKVSEIVSTFDQASQSFICKVAFNDKMQQSIYGTQLEANIKIASKKQALLIPRTYLDYGNRVHLKGNKELVKVTTGIVSSEYVEIIKGLNEKSVLLPLNP